MAVWIVRKGAMEGYEKQYTFTSSIVRYGF